MAILSVPVTTMIKIVLVMTGAMTVLHKRLTCILTARQITIFPNLFLVLEPSLHALSKLVKKPQLQMGAL
ncbi:hypothetical protein DW816_09940 [Faecalibacterium prausnitzii]|nr:hypothetical protein DW816_09940 [Faecalibacterium prausnitzii]